MGGTKPTPCLPRQERSSQQLFSSSNGGKAFTSSQVRQSPNTPFISRWGAKPTPPLSISNGAKPTSPLPLQAGTKPTRPLHFMEEAMPTLSQLLEGAKPTLSFRSRRGPDPCLPPDPGGRHAHASSPTPGWGQDHASRPSSGGSHTMISSNSSPSFVPFFTQNKSIE